MKRRITWEVGIGLATTGGVGMIIDYICNRIPSPEFWILAVSFCAGIIAMVISHYYWNKVTSRWKRLWKYLKTS